MKVLVIGSGGREHALAWKVAQSLQVQTVFVAPGNVGMLGEPKLECINIDVEAIDELLNFARDNAIDLTIVGPEAPLVIGVVDAFQHAGLTIWGPTQGAAQLEGSKSFTKDFLARHNIPTASYGTFTDIQAAIDYIDAQGAPIVVKADGLAAGKGVVVAETTEQAKAAVHDMLAENKFGDAGAKVVIEEFLIGEEMSFICMVDGVNILPMATSQDHKARDNGDKGPNTGGMGAYSPAPVGTQNVLDFAIDNIIKPTVNGMAAEGNTYTGFLYAGLMVAPDGTSKILEYNCRFGDPETQPIMMRLESDLAQLCLDGCAGKLDQTQVQWSTQGALGVVMAAAGYPENPRKGDVIHGLQDTNEAKVFHAGTKADGEQIITNGGRVLCVTALGDNITQAQANTYAAVKKIKFDGAFFRTDIGYRAVEREQQG